MPQSAIGAQPPLLYVAQQGISTISEYNASNGGVLYPKLIIPEQDGPIGPTGLAVSGKFLFVASSGNNTVLQYEASSGSENWHITGSLSTPTALAVSPDGKFLFVANWNSNRAIFRFNAATGAGVMWQPTPTQFDLGSPSALAVSADGKTLFVAHNQQGGTEFNNFGYGSVSTYNANSGTVDKGNFITGLSFPYALAVSADGKTLFVANNKNPGFVSTYSATSGAPIKTNFITGLPNPYGIAVLNDTLYVVTRYEGGGIGTYSATSGAPIKAHLITGPNQPYGIALIP
jgi:DNA-binding beta-propeller fold protein YncE